MKKVLFLLLAVISLYACNTTTNNTDQDQTSSEAVSPQEDIIEVAIIDVTGMHCGACEKAITSALTEMDGVSDAKVSLEDETATVTFSSSKVEIEEFKTAIEGKGYGVSKIEILKEEEPKEDQTE